MGQSMKTIIFDFDGTIANTLPFHFKKVIEIAKKYKITNLSEKEIIQEVRSKSPRQLMTEFKLSWLKLPSVFSVIKQAQKELNKSIEQIKIFPGIDKVLKRLKKNYCVGILSSNIKENIDKFLQLNKLEIFNFVYCESNIFGKDKALNNLVKKFNLLKENVYYIGDEVRDIEGCQKAGIKIISVGWGLHDKKLLLKYYPDYFAEKPEEIIGFLI